MINMAASMNVCVSLSLLFVLFANLLMCVNGQFCALPLHDMGNLTLSEWTFSSTNLSQCLGSSTLPTSNCFFTMRLCGSIAAASPNCSDASVCQNLDQGFKLAGASDKPFSELPQKGMGFVAKFPPGQNYEKKDNTTCQLNTIMTFLCNSKKPWPRSPDRKPQTVPFTPVIVFKEDKCLFNITFEFAGACVMISPPINNDTPLSAGSVLLIIFFVFILAYFIFGAIYNLAFRGARGKEVIPNADFWMLLPVYIADGFIFTFRCGQAEPTTYESI